jgi:hypothetical protein
VPFWHKWAAHSFRTGLDKKKKASGQEQKKAAGKEKEVGRSV